MILVGIPSANNSAQAYATDNKSNIPGPLPSRLFIIGISIVSRALFSYKYQDQSIEDIYPVHWE